MSGGRLVSLNVGLPRDVAWQGKAVHTAIWKDPVAGPRMVRTINVDGDGQGDRMAHGGEHRAVFVYQLGSYRYWEEQLGRDDFVHGQFGENLTVDGLADDEVCIGDRYRIGGALFEVTQPRVTCYRVGIRMADPRMPSLLVAHHRPGFYLRVLEEGEVQADDEIEKVLAGPHEMTVADVDALLYLPDRTRPDLARALEIPALSDGWKGSFRQLLEQPDPSGRPPAVELAWEGFRDLEVTAITAESETITSFELTATDEPPAAAPLPGQSLTLRLGGGEDGPRLLRSYSLSARPAPGRYRISVKREADGAGSRFLHDAVEVGDVVEAAAPRGPFVLEAGTRAVALLSGGVGATPLMAMLSTLAATRSPREVWWIHSSRTPAEQPFADEVEGLLDALPAAHRLVVHTRDDAGRRARRLDGALLDDAGVPADADCYLCGPPAFTESLSAALAARGVPAGQIRSETFGAVAAFTSGIVGGDPQRAPHQPAGPPGTGPRIAFARSAIDVAWDDRYASLLELAEACDVPVSFGCRTGVCHACESGLLSGDVSYEPDPLEPPAAGNVLMCCSRPEADVSLDL